MTNNAVQAKLKDYGKYESGNILSFEELQKMLDAQGDAMPDFVQKKLVPDIMRQVETTFESVRSQLKMNRSCFEIFGFDFIVDSNFDTWLLEVNTNPCLEEPSPILGKLVPRMVNDALKLTIDTVFLPRKGQQSFERSEINIFEVPGYDSNVNMW